MKKALFVISLLSYINSFCQERIHIINSGFTFSLTKVNNEGIAKITKIDIYKDDIQLQTIIPEDNSFYTSIDNQAILDIEDLNFDNHIDIRMLQHIPFDDMLYLSWLYNVEKGIFERNKSFDKITFPEFNTEKKEITSRSFGYLRESNINIYKVKDNTLILIEKYDEKIISGQGKKKFKLWKLVNGKLKLTKEGVVPIIPK